MTQVTRRIGFLVSLLNALELSFVDSKLPVNKQITLTTVNQPKPSDCLSPMLTQVTVLTATPVHQLKSQTP